MDESDRSGFDFGSGFPTHRDSVQGQDVTGTRSDQMRVQTVAETSHYLLLECAKKVTIVCQCVNKCG